MKIEVEINPPTPPNFIVVQIAGNTVSVPIGELTREKAKEYADMVHASIMKHHGKRGKELKDKKNDSSEKSSNE